MSCNTRSKRTSKVQTSKEPPDEGNQHLRKRSGKNSAATEPPADMKDSFEVQFVVDLEEESDDQRDVSQEDGQKQPVFRCTVCDWYYLSKEGLWNHLERHMNSGETGEEYCEELVVPYEMYDCELCGDHRLYQEDSYRQHISEAHDESLEEDVAGECACPTCGDVFGSYNLLSKHIEQVHPVVVCGICAASFSNEQELIEHKNTHHLEKSFSCPDCLEVMPDEKTLKDHSDVCSKMIFPCDLCNAEFANYSYLEMHKAQTHPQETAEHVEFTVQDSSSDEESVDENVPAANVGIKMEFAVEETALHGLQLQADDQTLFTISDLDPMEQFLGDSPVPGQDKDESQSSNQKQCRSYKVGKKTFYECLTCGESFEKYTAYRWHRLKIHIGTDLICPHCSKKVWKQSLFESHTAKCALKKFPCEFCTRKYATKEAVLYHTKESHKNEIVKLHVKRECTVCDETFVDSGLHFEHMKICHDHSVQCTLCTMTFVDDDELTTHMISDHERVSYKSALKCVPCNINFRSVHRFNMHKQKIHQNLKHKCPKCSLQFSRKHTFLEHKSQCVGRILNCKLCNATHSTAKALEQHIKRRHKSPETVQDPSESPAIKCECPICWDIFGDGFQLSNHVQEIHQMSICTICAKVFNNDVELIAHKLTTHPEPSSAIFMCPHCTKSYRSSAMLNRHLDSCGPRMCSVCDQTFSKHSHHMAHMKDLHPEVMYTCPFCPRKFIEETDYVNHSGYCAERKYSCSQCDASRKTLPEFKRHVALTGHADEPVIEAEDIRSNLQLPCPICRAVFRCVNTRRSHMATAHREPHIQCPRCDLAFHYKSRLLTHLRNHDRRQLKIKLEKHKKTQNKLPKKRRIVRKAEPVKCKKCDAVFRTSNYLKYHLRTMHEEPQIKCPKCEKAFHFKSRLLEHLRTHQREIKVKVAKVKKVIKKEPIPRPVPVLCSHCDKSCRSNAILNRHLQICGPRTCNVCEQNFDKYNSYRKHMRTMHPSALHRCSYCPRTFVEKLPFQNHLKYCAERRYSCRECDTSRKTLDDFKRHVALTGHAEEPVVETEATRGKLQLPCSICKAVFRSVNTRRFHMATAHKEPHIKCPKCDKAFHYKSRLRMHLKNHDRVPVNIKIKKEKVPKKKLPKKRKIAVPEGPQSCPKCNAVFRALKNLKYHMRIKHTKPKVKCPKCDKEFHFKSQLSYHLPTHDNLKVTQKATFTCLRCNHPCRTSERLERHMKTCNPRTCNVCQQAFNKHSDFKKHMDSFHPDVLHKCTFCPKAFIDEARYQNHVAYCAERRYSCSECDTSRKTLRQIKRHIAQTGHSQQPLVEAETARANIQLPCPICKVIFRSVHTRRSHMATAHTEPHIKCPKCDRAFHYQSRLEKHLRNHDRVQVVVDKPQRPPIVNKESKITTRHWRTKIDLKKISRKQVGKHHERPIPCTMCTSTFHTRTGLEYHVLTVHREPELKCSKCEKTFHFKSRLLEHMRVHGESLTKNVEPKKFKCEMPQTCKICNVEFPTGARLRYHTLTAHREARFKCTKCPRAFFFVSKLRIHLRGHDRVIPKKDPKDMVPSNLTCEICDVTLNSAHAFRVHRLTVHTKPRFKCPNCDKWFHFRSRLLAHIRVHKTELNNRTPEDLTPKDPQNIQIKKEKSQKGVITPCPVCKAEFISSNAKRFHMATAHVAPGIKCPRCEKAFHFQSQLVKHLVCHSDVKFNTPIQVELRITKKQEVHPCQSCSTVFGSRSMLKYHEATVHTAPSIQCPLCVKAFHFQYRLVKHLNTVHKGETTTIKTEPLEDV
ncbi:zinc finger protein 91 [Aedes albopictus]|uniref:C2H2-type domain-containing protein n=1 Tax=Aedes albopictus TaxID=7160 RepID=A0ABM1YEI5_AEDAL|nr:zinc finger protein 91 isoform X2 [Aedes albopictus]